jgi:hypothetical protein
LARSKTLNKPVQSKSTKVMKKDVRSMLKAVGKEVASYRPDLKVCT